MDFKDRLSLLGIALASAVFPSVTYLAMAVFAPQATGLLLFWVPFVLLPCVVAAIGFSAVAVFGSQTTLRNGNLRMAAADEGVFLVALIWSFAAMIFALVQPEYAEEGFAVVWGVPVVVRLVFATWVTFSSGGDSASDGPPRC